MGKISMICVSACLAGCSCRYDGKSHEIEGIRELVEKGEAVPVCPEELGGLPTPRLCAEIQKDGHVRNTAGIDVTQEYQTGAKKALEICLKHGCTKAILKSSSPSCGCNGIYDGSFSHSRIPGDGIFAQMLKEHGIRCIDDTEWKKETYELL